MKHADFCREFNRNGIVIGNLQLLKYLDITYNQLEFLPKSIGNLKSLKSLGLERNRLIILPEIIGNLKSLEILYLIKNQLTNLPESIGNLKSLKKLDLKDNQFTSLPENIGKLENLQSINLKGNKIRSLSNIHLEILKIAEISPDHLSSKGQSLFNSKNYNKLYKYYRKSPKILAQQYITDPKSLTSDEKERLVYEAGHLEKKILELKVDPDDPILAQITERLVVGLSSGFNLHL